MILRFNGKKHAFLSATLIVLGLFLPLQNIHAQESPMQSAMNSIAGTVSALLNLPGNNALSPAQKQKQELQARKDAVQKVFDLTLMEQSDLRDRLANLDNLTPAQKKMQGALTDQLTENENSFAQIRDRLDAATGVDQVKQLAADFKNWRAAVYDLKIRKMVPFIFVFQEESIIATAQQRLQRITADFTAHKASLGAQSLEATALFEKGTSAIKTAQDLHNQAKIIIMVALTDAPSPTATPAAVQKANDAIARNIAGAKTLTENSLQDINDAYDIFISLGQLLK